MAAVHRMRSEQRMRRREPAGGWRALNRLCLRDGESGWTGDRRQAGTPGRGRVMWRDHEQLMI